MRYWPSTLQTAALAPERAAGGGRSGLSVVGSWGGLLAERWIVMCPCAAAVEAAAAAPAPTYYTAPLPPCSWRTDAVAVRDIVQGFRNNVGILDRPLFFTGCSCELRVSVFICLLCLLRGARFTAVSSCHLPADILMTPLLMHVSVCLLPVAAGGSLALRLPGLTKIDGVMSGRALGQCRQQHGGSSTALGAGGAAAAGMLLTSPDLARWHSPPRASCCLPCSGHWSGL